MSDEILVKCENVSKKFCRSLKRSLWYGVKDICSELNPLHNNRDIIGTKHFPKLREDEFWAVNGISFELKRGECLGLIGHNGAGKSTLLKLLYGLIKPDHGQITMKGRIGALIELNAGFNPILTGRENVYIYGSILGFSKKEIDVKYNDIVEFAELEEFMGMPFRSYSSGMKVRLGFAVAAQMEPDVLIIDEVLAVGDIGFKIKCLNLIHGLLKKTAVIFVSHTMPYISESCTNVLLLEKGVEVLSTNDVSLGISEYSKKFQDTNKITFNTGKASVFNIQLLINNQWEQPDNHTVYYAEDVNLKLTLHVDPSIKAFTTRLIFMNQEMRAVSNTPSEIGNNPFINTNNGNNTILISIPAFPLNIGKYGICLVVFDDQNKMRLLNHNNIAYLNVYSNHLSWCNISPKTEWKQLQINI